MAATCFLFSIQGLARSSASCCCATRLPASFMYRYSTIGSVVGAIVWGCACVMLSEPRQLELSRLDYDAVEGVYTERSGTRGIRFLSTVDTLHVSDLGGNVILSASKRMGPFRVVRIGEAVFLQYSLNGNVHEYEVPSSVVARLQNSTLSEALCWNVLAAASDAIMRQSVESSILQILEKPETLLLEPVAFSMGEEYAINGREYTCALPFYIAALRVKELKIDFEIETLHNNLHMSDAAPGYTLQSSTHGNSNDSCLQLCPPCPEESCLGMCGPDCKCWSFVCGDCCYHLGCYDHDVCCRKKFYRTACLFPVTFRCEHHYNCTSAEGWQ